MKFSYFCFPGLRCGAARESLLFLLNALNDRQTDRLDFATPPSSRLSEKLSTRPSIFFHLSSVRQQGSFLVVRFLVSLELSSQSALALAPTAAACLPACLPACLASTACGLRYAATSGARDAGGATVCRHELAAVLRWLTPL